MMAHQSQLTRPLYSLTIGGGHILAKCWKITRKDGVTLRFTDHSSEVVLSGETYSPAGGFLSSAEEGQDGLKAGNREIQGILTSGKITETDLRAGLYRGAKIEEFTVNPIFPWMGILRQNLYWLQEVRYNGQNWDGQLEGPLNKLRVTKGYTHERRCRWENFGDSNCGFPLNSVKVSGASVSSIDTARRIIETSVTTKADDYFNDGRITWTSGNNAGLISDVYDYTQVGGVLTLYVETPYDIHVGDAFDLVPGCDRQFTTCQNYGNTDNFGGFPSIPGNDDTFTTPDPPTEDT